MRKKRISLGVLIALIAITATLTLSLTYQYALSRFNAQIQNLNEREQLYNKLSQVDDKTRDNFFFSVDENALNDAIAKGYVNGLGDAHSSYLTAAEASPTLQELGGSKVGIGIEVTRGQNGEILITRVMANSPASIAGLQKGDCIVSIDGHLAAEDTYKNMVSYLSGSADTEVMIDIKRSGVDENISFTLTRKEFSLETVTARVVNKAIGYIRIYEFSDHTGEEFSTALTGLVKSGITGLVIDVRDNPGGVLKSVADVLDMILPAGNIVSAEYKDGTKKILYTSDSAQLDIPISVIVNGGSASGAELLAAAVKDYGKGKIVGTQTYGKGTMQDIYSFSDGSALRLTVAKYYPPLSGNFDGVGVQPDITIEQSDAAKANPYFLSDEEDTQLSTAISALIISGADVSNDVTSSGEDAQTQSGTAQSESETSSTVTIGFAPEARSWDIA